MSLLHGPIIIDLAGLELTEEEQELLQHPLVGGVILFSRNFESIEQVYRLIRHCRTCANRQLLITVDHEGGRVQRFRQGFTALPAMGKIGKLYEFHPEHALQLAEICGWLLANELLSIEIDLSFAPVLDLNKVCPAIGDRAFHHQDKIVIELAKALVRGMQSAGMAATGKHFPGHGSVDLDSHFALPTDHRNFDEIASCDLLPFIALAQAGIHSLMCAHIVYPQIAPEPVGFSKHWLKNILRDQIKFSGTIFSDDLNMEGCKGMGNAHERAEQSLQAGCDMVLICNNRTDAIQILDHLPQQKYLFPYEKIKNLRGNFSLAHSLKDSEIAKDKRNIFLKLIQKIE